MKRKFCELGSGCTEYKRFLPDYMKNLQVQAASDLKRREKKAYSKLKTTLKDAMVPLKSK